MLSAIVWNAFLSPWAFSMSYLTPAALNAAVRFGLSAVSQRCEDLVSGRITPTYGAFVLEVVDLLLLLQQAARPPSATAPTVATTRIPLRIARVLSGYAPHVRRTCRARVRLCGFVCP